MPRASEKLMNKERKDKGKRDKERRKLLGSGMSGKAADAILKRRQALKNI